MWHGAAKRGGDLILTLLLAVPLAPLAALCAIAVRWRDGAPVLFRQVRVGRAGRPFTILKFRTMAVAPGAEVTVAGDRRITPLGRILRGTKFDELPQLWNVLMGEMALVGPRPEVPSYVDRYPGLFRGIRGLRPGVTDWASLAFRDEEAVLARHQDEAKYYERVLLPRKIALARLYGRHASVGLDLRLIGATGFSVIGAEWGVRLLAGRGTLTRARRGVA